MQFAHLGQGGTGIISGISGAEKEAMKGHPHGPPPRLSPSPRMKPKLAAFPKCYLDELCVHRTMTPRDWIEIGATLGVDGLEFFSGFLEDDEKFLRETKELLEKTRT